MSMGRLAAFVAGALVGAAAMWAWPRPVVSTAERPAERRFDPAPGVAPVPVAPAEVEGDGCAGARDLLTLENAVLRGQLATLGGAPSEWPDEVPDAFREAPVAAWLDEAARDLPVRRVALDCAEFPCVAVFRYDDDQPASSSVVGPLREAFRERTRGLGQAGVHVFGTPHGAWAALSLGPADDGALAARIDVRVKELVEAEQADGG